MSTTETSVPRYRTFDPSMLTEEGADTQDSTLSGNGPLDKGIRYLTWGILSVCLALWAVVGFVFWIPLLLRSMIQFSLSLSQSMLRGTRPDEAGRILRDTVGFYRRGFTVAIRAVFGETPTKKQAQRTSLTFKEAAFEIAWAALVWYGILLFFGAIETSPVDLWNSTMALPWGEWWTGVEGWVTGWFEGGAAVDGAGVEGVVEGAGAEGAVEGANGDVGPTGV